MPTVPLVLNGELVEDLERMNAEYPGDLYVTPVVYNGSFALAAFTDAKVMLAEARKMQESEEFHEHMKARAIGCLPEGSPAPTVLDCFSLRDLRGDKLRLRPGESLPDLSRVPISSGVSWNNNISSIEACAYPYTAAGGKNFTGAIHFINFRCSLNVADAWGVTISSIRNWGTDTPNF